MSISSRTSRGSKTEKVSGEALKGNVCVLSDSICTINMAHGAPPF